MNGNLNGGEYYRKRAMQRLGAVAVVVVLAGGAIWYFARSDSLQKISSLENSAAHLAAEEFSKTFSAPPPLVATGTVSFKTGGTGGGGSGGAGTGAGSYALSIGGVIIDTNAARATNGGLPALLENATLNDIAQVRLDDMFAKQYFAHVSPSTSSSAETVAAAVGYDYIALGENLALGDFAGDQGVVTAWMNSPGHRANILNTHYTEIGVAVGEGSFQGNESWIAVQIFGRPLSDCPVPDANFKVMIVATQSQISQIQSELQTMQAQMDAMQPRNGGAYNQKVSDYNALVDQYNTAVAQAKADISQYNAEVNTYNQCIKN